MGVDFLSVAGRYKAGTNPIKGKAIVEAALEFMRTDPNRSLGIVTLNQKQRDLINEEFEYVLGSNSHAVKYIEAWKERNDGLEEFFIKNLENVQGDDASDITAEEHTNPGAYMLRRWLEYSASGVLESGERTEREPDSSCT
jgi:hypothetical protein